MIVLEDPKVVIITPPHTASGHLHQALCERPQTFWVCGPTPTGRTVDHHYARVANGWADFRVALVWRNPLDRLVGLYEHYAWWESSHQRTPIQFPPFVTAVCRNDPDLGWFYTWTIAKLVGSQRVDELIEFDNLEGDVTQLIGSPITLAPPNAKHPPTDAYLDRLDPEPLGRLNSWAVADIRLYERFAGPP